MSEPGTVNDDGSIELNAAPLHIPRCVHGRVLIEEAQLERAKSFGWRHVGEGMGSLVQVERTQDEAELLGRVTLPFSFASLPPTLGTDDLIAALKIASRAMRDSPSSPGYSARLFAASVTVDAAIAKAEGRPGA
jgi:hypothetical protein